MRAKSMQVGDDREDVEVLLTREGRARLPLRRQLVLYLDPFAFFKDAAGGTAWSRESAMSYNRERRSILLMYVRRWLLIAATFFLGIASAEALSAHVPLFIIPAAGFGICCSIAVTVAAWTAAAYVLLGRQPLRP